MTSDSQKDMGTTLDELQLLDWDLQDANTNKYSSNIHPYHARFIPQIPERLINSYTSEDDLVLDPFNGSGTTTMIAGVMRRNGVGVDLNPLACLIARVKCRNYDIEKLETHVDDFLKQAKHNVRAVDSQPRLDDFSDTETDDIPLLIPDFPDQERWYIDNVLQQMGALFYLVEDVETDSFHDFYRVCFSGITKSVCRSDEDWTYIGDNMYPDKDTNKLTPVNKVYDIYQKFENQVNRVLRGVKRFSEANPVEGEIYQTDSRDIDILNDNSVDFAITSPPYANAVDYARYHRLSFYWFDWEVTETKEDEIGARSKRGRKNAVEDYFDESREVYEEVFRVLKPESRFCVVVGDTQHKKERVEAVNQISNICEDIGYNKEGEIVRKVSGQSMSQKNITEESLLLLSKP